MARTISTSKLRSVLKQLNIDFIDNENNFCDFCMEGKHHRLPFSISKTEITAPSQIVSADLGGPSTSIGGSRYFLLIKDHYSHYRVVYFLKFKSEAVGKLKSFLTMAKKDTGNEIRILRTDNGTEFVTNELNTILNNLGIRHRQWIY